MVDQTLNPTLLSASSLNQATTGTLNCIPKTLPGMVQRPGVATPGLPLPVGPITAALIAVLKLRAQVMDKLIQALGEALAGRRDDRGYAGRLDGIKAINQSSTVMLGGVPAFHPSPPVPGAPLAIGPLTAPFVAVIKAQCGVLEQLASLISEFVAETLVQDTVSHAGQIKMDLTLVKTLFSTASALLSGIPPVLITVPGAGIDTQPMTAPMAAAVAHQVDITDKLIKLIGALLANDQQ